MGTRCKEAVTSMEPVRHWHCLHLELMETFSLEVLTAWGCLGQPGSSGS